MRSRQVLAVVLGLALLAREASAQLLPSLLSPVQPVLQTVNTLTCSLSALPSSPKLDGAVKSWAEGGGAGSIRVIVTPRAGLLSTVTTLVASLTRVIETLVDIEALVAEVGLNELNTLACDPNVSSISFDAPVKVSNAADEDYTVRSTLGLPSDLPAGQGIGVAIIDSGIAPVSDLSGRIAAFFDFTKGGVLVTSPSDAFGHGTHVAGLVAASGAMSAARYRGMAPSARLVGMKVLDQNGGGRTSDVIRAILHARRNRALLGIDIINLSLGHPIYEPASRDPLVRAVEAAIRSGIVVVAAAGNNGMNKATGEAGYGGITSPGNAPSAITVGALRTRATITRKDDEVALFSSRGPTWYDGLAKPDIVAPGQAVVSTIGASSLLYAQYPTARVAPGYLQLSGTSMAAGVTTGAVALILEASRRSNELFAPRLTPNAVKAVLQHSSLRVKTALLAEYDELTQGAGALNVAGALEMARAIDTTRPETSYWLTRSVAPQSMIAGQLLHWSETIVWGSTPMLWPAVDWKEWAWRSSVIWGSDVSWSRTPVAGENVVWGDRPTSIWPDHIVWGEGYVGSSRYDDDHIVWGSTGDPETTVWGNLAGAPSTQAASTPAPSNP